MTTLYIDPGTLRASPTPLPGYERYVRADTCRHCGGDMLPRKELEKTVVCCDPDTGDVERFGTTGPVRLVPVSKCADCGWSVSAQTGETP